MCRVRFARVSCPRLRFGLPYEKPPPRITHNGLTVYTVYIPPTVSDCERDLAPEVSFELGTQELRSWNELGSAK